jgi:organic hydroperoxide reductase OsmC/OhrA
MVHKAGIRWELDGDFARGAYARAHRWQFDGGAEVPGSASPDIVPPPHSDPTAVDPEEAFVASIASCHMLWFLDLARRAGHEVLAYSDDAVGAMTRTPEGAYWISRVDLNPMVVWAEPVPDPAAQADLHHKAHKACFIANSVKSEIVVNLPEG